MWGLNISDPGKLVFKSLVPLFLCFVVRLKFSFGTDFNAAQPGDNPGHAIFFTLVSKDCQVVNVVNVVNVGGKEALH